MKIEKIYTLDFRTNYGIGVTIRQIWQQLFNYYWNNGGDMDNLSNLLVDYDIIKFDLEKCTEKTYTFGWNFCRWSTNIDRLSEYKDEKEFMDIIYWKNGGKMIRCDVNFEEQYAEFFLVSID